MKKTRWRSILCFVLGLFLILEALSFVSIVILMHSDRTIQKRNATELDLAVHSPI